MSAIPASSNPAGDLRLRPVEVLKMGAIYGAVAVATVFAFAGAFEYLPHHFSGEVTPGALLFTGLAITAYILGVRHGFDADHIAAIESDAGAAHPLGFDMKMPPAAIARLQPLRDILRPIGATIFQSIEYSPGSDIDPLVEAGVPGIGIMQDGRKYFDYHHTAADTLDKVDPQDLRENAAAMAVMGYALAAMPDPLPR